MERSIIKFLTILVASICTMMALSTSVSACSFFFYQPEEPECLKTEMLN